MSQHNFFHLAANLGHYKIKLKEENSYTIQFQHPLLSLLAGETLNKTVGHGWQELINVLKVAELGDFGLFLHFWLFESRPVGRPVWQSAN